MKFNKRKNKNIESEEIICYLNGRPMSKFDLERYMRKLKDKKKKK